ATPAHALDSALVSNLGKSSDGGSGAMHVLQAQSFTTGGNSLGYALESIDLDIHTAPGSDDLTVTVRESDSGDPGDTVYTLTNPAVLSSGVGTYLAPDDATLDPNTTYWVHIHYSGGGTKPRWRYTNSNNEDSGKHPGWSIGNDRSRSMPGFPLQVR
ncbi:MAG: hypothetical protein J4G14_15235, partial [Dehalococcoidia bacterium]|nr:hypothetical protein [Dehalococcoidia bacterium]